LVDERPVLAVFAVLRLVDHRAFAAIHNARFRRFRLNFFERLVEIAKRRPAVLILSRPQVW
jgi:hypothetical protein